MTKDELKDSLKIKELVKPNLSEMRLSQGVESLCTTFECTGFFNRPYGDVVEEDDILF